MSEIRYVVEAYDGSVFPIVQFRGWDNAEVETPEAATSFTVRDAAGQHIVGQIDENLEAKFHRVH